MKPLEPSDPRTIGPFPLLAQLGRGGMGRVYLGRAPDGSLVAIKVIHDTLAQNPRFRARFAREIEAAARVPEIHTPRVVQAGPDDTPPWMATAYIPAPSLQEAVDEHGPLSHRAALFLAARLAAGLAAIHASGLVHRDLTPRNVLLAIDQPKIIDFGIARVMDASRLTAQGSLLGTYAYMSPEQLSREQVGPPSDVFSLGSLLAFAASGRSPFLDETIPPTINSVDADPPEFPRLPDGDLRELVVRCLRKEPAQRPRPEEIVALLEHRWPEDDGWLPARIVGMIVEKEREAARLAKGESLGLLSSAADAGEPGRTPPVPAGGEPPGPPRTPLWKRPLLLIVPGAALVIGVAAVAIGVLIDPGRATAPPPVSATPTPTPASTPTSTPTPTPSPSPSPSPSPRREVTDDGRAFQSGGWSQFTVTVDPDNTGVRITRRFDADVAWQSASISVNGRPAGMWEPVPGARLTWMDQTVRLPLSVTDGRSRLTIRNTYEDSTKDFNEFRYVIEQRIGEEWERADVVDVGPSHTAQEKAHDYRITEQTWRGTRTFRY
ncbi:MAG: protein kinase [Streptosporangiales bacterium]|nr:protein kinase [Streptosporangiales bacterium]